MGAVCSSGIKNRYVDFLSYLRSKSCSTYTYLVSFKPLYMKLPYIIILGENHESNPSQSIEKGKRNCSTITGILNEIVSTCNDPSVKTTIFLENNYKDSSRILKKYDIKESLLKIPDIENPFNVNRQEVFLNFVRNNYSENSIEIIDSDIFYIARYAFILSGKQNIDDFKEYTIPILKRWLKEIHNISDEQFLLLEQTAKSLSDEYLESFEVLISSDEFIRHLSFFSFIVMVFLEQTKTVLFNENVYNNVFDGFTERFNVIESNYTPSFTNKRSIQGETKDHSFDIGMVITYLSDCLNFHRMSSIKGFVVVSYGQRHAENFEDMITDSRWYKNDFIYGEKLN